jgi:hypothetical protein
MKKTFFLAGVVFLLFSLAINAQDTTANKPVQTPTTQDTNPAQTQPTTQQKSNPTQSQPTTQEQKKYGNPTVDSILSKYTLVPMPSQVTTEQIFPVIGQYQSSTNSNEKLTITLDDQNKGLVWVDGLPQGKVKAVEKKSPATYKIPAQKTAEGNDVPEGTLIYDKDTKVITVLLGRPFNDQDPASVFATATTTNDQNQSMTTNDQAANDQSKMNNDQSKMNATKTKTVHNKTKTKMKKPEEPAPYVFTGTKIEQVTAANQ